MNLIIEESKYVNFYTDMTQVMCWLGDVCSEYDWLITDIDGGWVGIEDPCLITGEELKLKLAESDWQFIWAVFSALPKGANPKVTHEPYADGNANLWKGTPTPQLKEALFEIVCWDSSATLFIGLPQPLGKRLVEAVPDIKNLNEMNQG
jgi:hypothetical protein